MKTKLLISSILLFLIGLDISAQTLELHPIAPGNSKVVRTSVTNGISSTYQWTETDPLNIISGVTGVTLDSVTILASPISSDGQTASVNVQAASISAGCLSGVMTLNIVIKNPGNESLKAAFGAAPASICQGSSAPFTLTFTGGAVTSYRYFVDYNGNGLLDGTEIEVTKVPDTGTSDNLSVIINNTGTIPVVISWINSALISAASDVSQSVTVDAKPVLGIFSF